MLHKLLAAMQALAMKRIAGAWEALLVYDCIIFGLTISKTWTTRRDHGITGISFPLTTLLLRDVGWGMFHFGSFVGSMLTFDSLSCGVASPLLQAGKQVTVKKKKYLTLK
ncbi:hypothetical protein D9619_011387 [Psilocybe cf. subviscida]|uniref:Uncharacterized protein n=1 Tax=Psilocybe cf. subviscida TaxID=2480587 RepID=A0A8H5BJQ4_9AGAR|nr:hypothetical protein D9619_011387 [Psilocybe cf. subviscida]